MPTQVTLLFIGDIVGKPGRRITREALPFLVRRHGVDLVVANVENAAGGNGITRETGEALRDDGVEVMTTGNHVWDKKEAIAYIEHEPRLLRPANYPPGVPGSGYYVARLGPGAGVGVGVVNVMGRIFMNPLDNPFSVVREQIATVRRQDARIVLVDFHAEATSEKKAMGWHLDGEATAVVGTHTHVQTADERILPKGHGVHHRRRNDGTARFDHRGRSASRPETLSGRHAGPVRHRPRQPAAERGAGDRGSRERTRTHDREAGSVGGRRGRIP